MQAVQYINKKLSYRKYDRAMHPIYECPENFRESLTMPAATFPVQNLKFVASPVPEIIGGAQKIWAVPGHAHAPFSPKF